MQRSLSLASAASFALLTSAAIGQCVPLSGQSYGGGDDIVVNSGNGIAIGFPFPVGGVTYDHVHPCTNGFAWLSNGGGQITNGDFTPTATEFLTDLPRVAPLWTDLDLNGGNGGEILVDTSVPGECTIVWHNAVPWGRRGRCSTCLAGCASPATSSSRLFRR